MTPTIYEWAGDREAFSRWLNRFYDHMLARHRNLGITPEQRLLFVTLLSRAADDVGLPSDPEFRAAIMGYAEWGTRLAQHNSQPGAEAVVHAPVPRWGWGIAPPYEPS